MYIFITILIILVGVLLGAIVLIQNPKGGGLSGSFGGVGQQLLGARRSSDIIEKLTWGFAGGLLILCLLSARFIGTTTTSTTEPTKSETEIQVGKQGLGAPAAAPGGGGAIAPATEQTTPAAGGAPGATNQ